MPELPDVETFRVMVQRQFVDSSISRIAILDTKSFEGPPIEVLSRRLTNLRLQCAKRRGKYLLLSFGEANVIVMHFGPAGTLCRVQAGSQPPPFVRFLITFSDGDTLAYVNRRRIGRVRLVESATSFIQEAGLGPDVLNPQFSFSDFSARLTGRDRAVKLVLMDQSKMAGIGNTWSDEILFRARINPAVPACDLTIGRIRRLFNSIHHVLRTAIDLDPTSTDFRARFPPPFLMPHRHPGGHCPRCGTELAHIRLSGHASAYCPRCQA
jgi:formamidopyrimidine-DNA glycosylase